MDTPETAEVLAALRSSSTHAVRELLAEAQKELKLRDRDPAAVPEAERGSPKDTAVQAFAGWALRQLKLRQGLSYREIGEIGGVSAERVRQLYEKLCPIEYGRESMHGSGS